MPNKEAAAVRDLSDDALVTRLAEVKAELFNLRFQHVTGQLDNYARLNEVRREVARINTLLREREIAAAEAAEAEDAGGAVAPTPEVQDAEKSKRRARVLASRRRAEAEQAEKEPSDG